MLRKESSRQKQKRIEEYHQKIKSDFYLFCSLIDISSFDYHKGPEAKRLTKHPYILKPFQRRMICYVEDVGVDKVILKGRQLGASTTLLAYCLWLVLYHPATNIIYVIDRQEKAKRFADKMMEMYNSLPAGFTPPAKKLSQAFKSEDRQINFFTGGTSVGRSDTYSMSIVDELAYMEPNIQNAIMGAINASSPSKRVFVSTPARENDIYHRLVSRAESQGTLFRVSYDDHDFLNEWFGTLDNAYSWIEDLTASMDEAQIMREYYCKFRGAVEKPIWSVDKKFFIDPPQDIVPNCFGLDLGYSDPTALLKGRVYSADNTLIITSEDILKFSTIPDIAKCLPDRYIWGAIDSSSKRGEQTHSRGLSPYAVLKNSISVGKMTTNKLTKEQMVLITQALLNEGKILISRNCEFLIEMLYNYEWDKRGKMPHNHYSHIHDAFVYMALGLAKNQGVTVKYQFRSKDHFFPAIR